MPRRGLEPVDDTVSACTGACTRVGLATKSVRSRRDVNRIVEEEVSLKELDALTNQRWSLVAFNLDNADLVVQVVDVVEVRGLITDHQVNRTRGLALTRSGEVSLTHLATTVNSERGDVLVLVTPTCDSSTAATVTEQVVDRVVVVCQRQRRHETIACSSSAIWVERTVTVQRTERLHTVAGDRRVASTKLTRDTLVEVGQSQLRVVLKDTSEVHLAVCFCKVLTGHVERVDEARCYDLTTMCVLCATACDDLGTRLDVGNSTRSIGNNRELTLRPFEACAIKVSVDQDLLHKRMELDEQLTIRRHQLIECRRENVW